MGGVRPGTFAIARHVLEKGIAWHGGEWQRVALARIG